MNKITKIGALMFALCTLLVSLHVIAATGDQSKEVSLQLTNGENSCDLHDYSLGTTGVSIGDQETDTVDRPVKCYFLNSNSNKISLQMTELKNASDNTKTIPANKFLGSVSSVTVGGTLNNGSNVADSNLGSPVEAYVKNANTAGVWSGVLAIHGTIPGGTPAGTYTGTINLTLQAN